jgi:DNA-binding transcriptional LysR family regulator
MTFPNLERGRVDRNIIFAGARRSPPAFGTGGTDSRPKRAGRIRQGRRGQQFFRGGAAVANADLDCKPPDRRTRRPTGRAPVGNLRLTELGAEVLEQAIHSAELSEAVDNILSNRLSKVCGTLRLSAPPTISDTLLTPIVTAFQTAYPDVRVQIFVTDRHIDHIAEGIDLAFRLGALRDSSLVARKVLAYRRQLVASPAYLQSCLPPEAPKDLLDHRLLAFWRREPEASWSFVHKDGRAEETITFRPYLAINDFAGLTPALLAGRGIGELPPVVQPELLRTGRLVEVMPDWRFPPFDLSLVHLGNRHVSKPCRLFKEFATQMAQALFPELPG